MVEYCRVYWGSHGCNLERGHDGPCLCECANEPDVDPETRLYPDGVLNVGAPPYYGDDTSFYGEDALAVKGKVRVPGVVVSVTPQRIVIEDPSRDGGVINPDGSTTPIYDQIIDAPRGTTLEVAETDTTGYPGFAAIIAKPEG